jgi:CheY-like chemotaxis protein
MNVNLSILIADDDADDRFMLKEAFEENGITNKLVFAEDGDELIKMLENEKGSHPKFPGLILLDLNMPKKDGREALKEIKGNKNLKHIPTIIFTTSTSENDLLASYNDGANSYIVKPNSYDKLLQVVNTLYQFWFRTVKIPGVGV